MSDIETLDGFYQRYPDDFRPWAKLISIVEETARKHGFDEVDLPAVERQKLGEDKWSEAWDTIYTFEDEGGEDVCLIPEQTPSRARMVQQRDDLTLPVRWFDTSKRWRYDEISLGRDREFYQTDFDIFGVESLVADADIIACAAEIFEQLGIAEDVIFCISNRKLLNAMLETCGIEYKRIASPLFAKQDLSREEFISEVTDKGIPHDTAVDIADLTSIFGPIDAEIERLPEQVSDTPIGKEALAELEELVTYLETYDVLEMCYLDTEITRALFYTGTVFEAFDSNKDYPALFGGGRFDNLVGMFGEKEIPAVGFGFGYAMTVEYLKLQGHWETAYPERDVLVAPAAQREQQAIAIAERLRNAGHTVELLSAGRSWEQASALGDEKNARAVVYCESDGTYSVEALTDENDRTRMDDTSAILEQMKQL